MDENKGNEYTLDHENKKREFLNACKIIFNDDVIINAISIEDNIMIVNYSILNNKQYTCLLNTTKSLKENINIFANDIDYEIEELIHHLNYKNDKWQSNIEGFCE